MRITLVFPPALCLPNPIYFALPLLAGALKRAGHGVRQVDLNVLAADRFLTKEWAVRVLDAARTALEKLQREQGAEAAQELEALLRKKEPHLREGPKSKAILRDPVCNFEPRAFNRAFTTVVEALDFFYLQGPLISPHDPEFSRKMTAHAQVDPWTPLRDLYDELFLDQVLGDNPEMVGITVAFPEQAGESVRLAAKLRERKKDLHICFGGPLISLFPFRWFEDGWLFAYADSVVVGDGETAVVELVEHLEGAREIESVRNLVHSGPGGKVFWNNREPYFEKMDELPLPDFESADLSLYLTPRPLYPIMLSRGCYWGKCTFCSMGWHQEYRQASKEKIRADVTELFHRYGARYLAVADSCCGPALARNLAAVIAEENLPVYWYGSLKFEKALLDKRFCHDLAKGGCRSLLMGLETANQRLLDLMNKGFSIEDAPLMLKNLREAGISAEMLWFLGYPGETKADVLTTLNFLKDHKPLYGLAAFVSEFLLHPDTEMCRRPRDFGITITGVDQDHCLYESTSGMSDAEKVILKQLLAPTGNRTLVCNGAHLPHLVETGLDLSGLENPLIIPDEVLAFCSR